MSTVKGSENALKSVLGYYYNALLIEGNEDPAREIATVVARMINFTADQEKFIRKTIEENDIKDIVENMIVVLQDVLIEQRLNAKGVNSVKAVLSTLTYLGELLKED